ncbi:MAG: hypothetical protein JRC89_14030 [Deltaproteobacteria bacterium]|nr:hypothetical protein [Deltaproteobacteria bacterium]MBW2644432.1 hypothetical protein [Deltaproteobacteria bacterium]
MIDLDEFDRDSKRYGRIKAGWHPVCIYSTSIKNSFKYNNRYVHIDFELCTEEYQDLLVPGFYNLKKIKDQWLPKQNLVRLAKDAGLTGKYENLQKLLKDLRGCYLLVRVAHRFRNRNRRDRVVDTKELPESMDLERQE